MVSLKQKMAEADRQTTPTAEPSISADQACSTSKAAKIVLDHACALVVDDDLFPHNRASAALALLDDLARTLARVAIDLRLEGSSHLQEPDG
ncbi:hypothetical protein [Brevundimonas aurantiaca]|jgi:hypothetical protein|uniref:hypothetical protein n=1 Tax=Brevundimonas aurantiaca TaxID=74316 RepID=UPI00174D0BB8|nr:hypothetical protein [Brevundimonas aurantiaca]